MLLRRTAAKQLPPWWVEALVWASGYGLYQLVQVMVTGSATDAQVRTLWLWRAEQGLRIDPELWLNQLLVGRHGFIMLAGLYYGSLHFAVTATVLIWLRARRQELYGALRTTLVVTSLIALFIYWRLPVAPPRLAVPGAVDVLKVDHILSAGSPSWPASLANQYAAMPSLHVAWALWVALVGVVAGVGRWRHLSWAYPVLTTIVVIATANHLLVDGLVSGLILGVVWFFCRSAVTDQAAPAQAPPGRARDSGRALAA